MFVMNIPTWVEIVSTIPLGAEPGGVESKHTCNATSMRASRFGLSVAVLKIIGSSD